MFHTKKAECGERIPQLFSPEKVSQNHQPREQDAILIVLSWLQVLAECYRDLGIKTELAWWVFNVLRKEGLIHDWFPSSHREKRRNVRLPLHALSEISRHTALDGVGSPQIRETPWVTKKIKVEIASADIKR